MKPFHFKSMRDLQNEKNCKTKDAGVNPLHTPEQLGKKLSDNKNVKIRYLVKQNPPATALPLRREV